MDDERRGSLGRAGENAFGVQCFHSAGELREPKIQVGFQKPALFLQELAGQAYSPFSRESVTRVSWWWP